jgi:hypothetical protein
MFWAAIVLGPLSLLGLLLVAGWLEVHVVRPGEHAQAIQDILNRRGPDDVEREVTRLLRPLDPPRRVVQ